MGHPIEIQASDLFGVASGGSLPTVSQGKAEAGTVYPSIDGRRLLTHVIGLQAWYIQTEVSTNEIWKVGRLYRQDSWSFGMDVSVGGTSNLLAKSLSGTKEVITNFLDIFIGCVSVAGGPVAWSILGMNILVAGGKIKQNYQLYNDALEAFVGDDMALRKMMPTFYDHMFVQLFLSRIESDLTGKAKEMATGIVIKNKAVANLVGVFIGKVGEDAMKKMLTGIHKIIKEVLLPIADHVISKGQISTEQVNQLVTHHLIPEFGILSRVPMRDDRAKEIIRETQTNPQAVKTRLQKIAKALNALNG
ncbi:MAG: hypothetical protein WKF92_02190 [Pyrinomonadaceae bacterium]